MQSLDGGRVEIALTEAAPVIRAAHQTGSQLAARFLIVWPSESQKECRTALRRRSAQRQVDRLLTGTFDEKKLAGLNSAVPRVGVERTFEVRKSDAFHDRFVIPNAGPIWMLGTFFTGLGKRLSVMVQVKDDAAARAIRTAFEGAWGKAEPVGQPPALAEAKPEPQLTETNGAGG